MSDIPQSRSASATKANNGYLLTYRQIQLHPIFVGFFAGRGDRPSAQIPPRFVWCGGKKVENSHSIRAKDCPTIAAACSSLGANMCA